MESEGFLHSRKRNYQCVSQAFADTQGITTLKSWDSSPQLQKQSQALLYLEAVILPGCFWCCLSPPQRTTSVSVLHCICQFSAQYYPDYQVS